MSLRAGPLSDDKVIALLNKFFAPVYAPYTGEETTGIVSSEEEREIQRIWRERQVYGASGLYRTDKERANFGSFCRTSVPCSRIALRLVRK